MGAIMTDEGIADDEFLKRNVFCPMVVMRFHLVYNGELRPMGNHPKPDHVRDIRNKFHPQLEYLWQVHTALKRLRQSAIVKRNPAEYLGVAKDSPLGPDRDLEKYPAREDEIDLCAPIQKGEKLYIPLIRKSLDLNCELNILFLRQEDPGALVLQGGDIDNRIKTLFDSLRMPDADVEKRFPQAHDPIYCLLENDTLVSGLSVSTDRLLFPSTEFPHEAHVVIEVVVRVLKVGSWNVCLL